MPMASSPPPSPHPQEPAPLLPSLPRLSLPFRLPWVSTATAQCPPSPLGSLPLMLCIPTGFIPTQPRAPRPPWTPCSRPTRGCSTTQQPTRQPTVWLRLRSRSPQPWSPSSPHHPLSSSSSSSSSNSSSKEKVLAGALGDGKALVMGLGTSYCPALSPALGPGWDESKWGRGGWSLGPHCGGLGLEGPPRICFPGTCAPGVRASQALSSSVSASTQALMAATSSSITCPRSSLTQRSSRCLSPLATSSQPKSLLTGPPIRANVLAQSYPGQGRGHQHRMLGGTS
uniref:CUGBP Elav-like family member 3 n=1 Tax=Callithrix jacchus TaxID=9483 RepID=A0A8I3X5R4_CALJA